MYAGLTTGLTSYGYSQIPTVPLAHAATHTVARITGPRLTLTLAPSPTLSRTYASPLTGPTAAVPSFPSFGPYRSSPQLTGAPALSVSFPGTLGPLGAQQQWDQFQRMLHIVTGVCCACGEPGRAVNRRWFWRDAAGHLRHGGTRECLCRRHRREARREGSVLTWLKVWLTRGGLGSCSPFCPGAEFGWVKRSDAMR